MLDSGTAGKRAGETPTSPAGKPALRGSTQAVISTAGRDLTRSLATRFLPSVEMTKGSGRDGKGDGGPTGRVRSPDPTVFWGVVGETPTLLRRTGQSGRQARPTFFRVSRAVGAGGRR